MEPQQPPSGDDPRLGPPIEPQRTPSDDDPRLGPIIAYLEQHRERINIEALRKQLREAGHPPELVDEAVRRVVGEEGQKPPAWPFGLLIALANFVILPFLFAGMVNLLLAIIPAANNNLLWLPLPLLLIAVVPVAQLLIGRRLREGPRDRLGRALIWGGVFTLAGMGLLLLLLGACVLFLMNLG
jgi:hypothetical protein